MNRRRIALIVGHLLMMIPATLILKTYGWKLWLAFLAYTIALRIAGYVKGQETR